MTKPKIKHIEELVTADLSNGRHVQKKIKKRVQDTGETCDTVVEKIKTQKRKRSEARGVE